MSVGASAPDYLKCTISNRSNTTQECGVIFIRALIIIFAVLLLILSLLLLKIKLRIKSIDSLEIILWVGPLKFSVYPTYKSKTNLSEFSFKKYKQKMMGLDQRKAETKKKENSENDGGFSEMLDFIKGILRRADKYAGYINTTISRCVITVGGGDAADTAKKYGYISQGIAYLTELLDYKTKLYMPKGGNFTVECDFTSSKTTVDIDISLSIRVFYLLKIIIGILILKNDIEDDKL